MSVSIQNNLGESIQYQVFPETTTPENYQTLASGGSFTLTSDNQYLALRIPSSDGFDFSNLSSAIHWTPLQFRRESDGNDNLYEVFVFQYELADEVADGVEGGDGDGGNLTPPEPPIPPSS